jgi:ribose transport system ATP-binding protein
LPSLSSWSRFGFINGRAEQLALNRYVRDLRIKVGAAEQAVQNLSGGNQQKVVLAKWLARKPRLLILDEPTRGIDVGAKSEIYALMDRLAREGMAILMISSDLEEVLNMSDRVLVMYQGQLAGELARAELTEEAVMHLATGGRAAS